MRQSPFESRRVLGLALPDNKSTPPGFAQLTQQTIVTPDVSLDFPFPERLVCLRSAGSRTSLVPVPETPMHENQLLLSSQNDIRCTGNRSNIAAIAAVLTTQAFSDQSFRQRVAPFDVRHYLASLFRWKPVGHALPLLLPAWQTHSRQSVPPALAERRCRFAWQFRSCCL